MSAHIIRMPKLSDTMEEGGIGQWLKKEGEKVSQGEPLLEIETDKATMEYVSPESGFLLKILVSEKKSSPLQSPICIIGPKDTNLEDVLGTLKALDSAEKKKNEPQIKSHDRPQDLEQKPHESEARIKASPLAKKIALAHKIDLSTVQGTGPNGRILSKDVPLSSSASLAMAQNQGSYTEPLSMMRKTIAKRLSQAKQMAPHFYLTVTCDGTALLAWKEKLCLTGDKVSINDLWMFLTAKALLKHPIVNSSWQEDSLLIHRDVHMAMAVALPSGLITPVLFHCDKLSVRDIAKKTKELGQAAKSGSLPPQDYQGGTFTISNLGMTVVDSFTAIINPPQAGILAIGRMKKVPAFDAKGQLIAQEQITVTLSCDHRVIDGMVGAQFLTTLKSFVEDPLNVLS